MLRESIHDRTLQNKIAAAHREMLLGQRGCVLWLTGLSGSGKSTLARALEQRLSGRHLTYVIDGDVVRSRLNSDLGFGAADRDENIRRIGEVAALFADAGLILIVAAISPYKVGREGARHAAGSDRFFEVYVRAPLEVCETRDPKGLYRRARRDEIPEFTGVSAPYEEPESPELCVDTADRSVADCTDQIIDCLRSAGFLAPPPQPQSVVAAGAPEA
jgi:adenylylsulfate kinase